MRISERSKGRRLVIFPPWFMSRSVIRQVEVLLPSYYHRRLRHYYDRYGCIRCNSKKGLYGGNGLCLHCIGLVGDRLKRLDEKLLKSTQDDSLEPSKVFLRRRESARELLADFRRRR